MTRWTLLLSSTMLLALGHISCFHYKQIQADKEREKYYFSSDTFSITTIGKTTKTVYYDSNDKIRREDVTAGDTTHSIYYRIDGTRCFEEFYYPKYKWTTIVWDTTGTKKIKQWKYREKMLYGKPQ